MRTPITEAGREGDGLRRRYTTARSLADFIAGAEANRDFWRSMHQRPAPAGLIERAAGLARPYHLLVLLEDWCWDAVNTITVLDRVAAEVPALDLRVLERDHHLDLMDRHLTKGTRSIPVVLVLDEAYRLLGCWGPRPAALQAWFEEHRGTLPNGELYRQMRSWYARDAGRSVLEEILAIAEPPRQDAAA